MPGTHLLSSSLVHVVIGGCGRVGSDLARALSEDGHDVTVIDLRPEALATLGATFDGHLIEGLVYDVDVLREAGIEAADVFVAVTDSDNANLMAVEVAKAVFSVPKTIARLYDPNRERSYRALGISYVTGTRLISKVIFEQIVRQELAYHVTFPGGDVEVVEFVLGRRAAGLTVADLEAPGRLRVAAVRRADHTHIPEPSFRLAEGDLVVAAARKGISARLRELCAAPEPA